jgi:hypothetical protein
MNVEFWTRTRTAVPTLWTGELEQVPAKGEKVRGFRIGHCYVVRDVIWLFGTGLKTALVELREEGWFWWLRKQP